MRSNTFPTRERDWLSGFVVALVLVALLAFAPRVGAQEQSQQASSEEPAHNGFILKITIHEIMESMMMPSAEAVWDSVAYISTAEGTIDAKPETEEDWQKLRWSAVTMAEGANALLIPGRRVDQPGAVADDDDELGPAEIQALIDDNRPAWIAFAQVMHATALETIRVIDAKDVDGVSDVGGTIDDACESCHLQFWYPVEESGGQ